MKMKGEKVVLSSIIIIYNSLMFYINNFYINIIFYISNLIIAFVLLEFLYTYDINVEQIIKQLYRKREK